MPMALRPASLAEALGGDTVPLKRQLRRVEARRTLRAVGLVLPAFAFLFVSFVVPILSLLSLSVQNPELPEVLPRTAAAIRVWDASALPSPEIVAAFVADLRDADRAKTVGRAGKRLNYDISGFRSLMLQTARDLPPPETPAPRLLERLRALDERWGDIRYWAAIKRAAGPVTDFYLLAALDRRRDVQGHVVQVPAGDAIYMNALARTFGISFVVTVVCLALGYPIAYLLAGLPTRVSNFLMILVLLPFWTSLLVRTTAWIVLLQPEGLLNDLAVFLGLFRERVPLIYNRTGVYVAMVHILLPFMVLPMYSVMKGISPSHMRAAASLGAGPLLAFWKVYLPQSMPGVAAGSLLVFILALGYYITPALVGGASDQMLSYFVAFFTNQTLNWGMAAALSVILLNVVLVMFAIFHRVVGIDRLKLG
jgi:putative spermidine/putrescine transport system permease protein